MAAGFDAHAPATARTAFGLPICSAICVYVRVVPAGISRSAAQTRIWNAVPRRSSGSADRPLPLSIDSTIARAVAAIRHANQQKPKIRGNDGIANRHAATTAAIGTRPHADLGRLATIGLPPHDGTAPQLILVLLALPRFLVCLRRDPDQPRERALDVPGAQAHGLTQSGQRHTLANAGIEIGARGIDAALDRRPVHGMRPAPLAGPEPRLLGLGRRIEELRIVPVRPPGRTTRLAVDAGRPNAHHER